MRAVAALLTVCAMGLFAACGDEKPETPAGARNVTVDAPGEKLNAVEMGDGAVGVVLAHGASTRKELWFPLMPALAKAGMHGIAFDFGRDRPGDIRAVMKYLRDAGAQQVVLVGSSLGAANSLDVASQDDVAAVVTFSTPSDGDWSITEPGLYIASKGDGGTADLARSLADRFDGTALVVDGSTHGADLLKPHPEVIERVVDFLQQSTTSN